MSGIVDRLRDVDDADARIIAHLDALDFSIEYVRDDLKSEYSGRELDEAYQLIMANQVSGDDFKDLIGEEFEAQTLFFEDTAVLVLPSTRYESVFASFDRHETLPVNELIEAATNIDS